MVPAVKMQTEVHVQQSGILVVLGIKFTLSLEILHVGVECTRISVQRGKVATGEYNIPAPNGNAEPDFKYQEEI